MKRVLVLLLAVCTALSVSACAGTDADNGKETIVVEEKYDENGNIIMEPLYMGWNLWYYNSYTYNADQKVEKIVRFTDNGMYLDDERYFYRADGTLEKVEYYWENVHSEIVLSCIELYDENGVIYKSETYEDGEVYEYTVYEYENGNCVKKTRYEAEFDHERSCNEYIYDDAGKCTRMDYYENYDRVYYCTYTYDAAGRVAKELKYRYYTDGQEHAAETTYTYHSNGRVKDKVLTDLTMRWEETWDERGGMVCDKRYELNDAGEWFMLYKVEYSGDMKIDTTYHEDGRYNTETMIGNASVVSSSERAYYNPDGSLFCTNRDGVFYDPAGQRMEPTIDMLAPWGIE